MASTRSRCGPDGVSGRGRALKRPPKGWLTPPTRSWRPPLTDHDTLFCQLLSTDVGNKDPHGQTLKIHPTTQEDQ